MKSTLLLLLTLGCTTAVAQESKFDVGFFVGATQRLNRIEPKEDEFMSVKAPNHRGGDAGAAFYYQATTSVSARATLGVHYESDELIFSGPTSGSSSRLNTLYWSTGLHALVKSTEQSRLQMVAGITPHSRLLNNNGKDGLGLSNFDLSADLGVAYALLYNKLKISPELRYGRSLTNVGASQQGLASGVNSYHRDRLSLTLYFSGF